MTEDLDPRRPHRNRAQTEGWRDEERKHNKREMVRPWPRDERRCVCWGGPDRRGDLLSHNPSGRLSRMATRQDDRSACQTHTLAFHPQTCRRRRDARRRAQRHAFRPLPQQKEAPHVRSPTVNVRLKPHAHHDCRTRTTDEKLREKPDLEYRKECSRRF